MLTVDYTRFLNCQKMGNEGLFVYFEGSITVVYQGDSWEVLISILCNRWPVHFDLNAVSPKPGGGVVLYANRFAYDLP